MYDIVLFSFHGLDRLTFSDLDNSENSGSFRYFVGFFLRGDDDRHVAKPYKHKKEQHRDTCK
jgi:hypothetical protein